MNHAKKFLHSGPGLLIGIPTLGRPVPLDWAFAFKSMNPPINYNVMHHVIKGVEVAVARNEMAHVALAKDAKYIFFLGDDTVPPAFVLQQLIYRMEQDPTVGVVGGVYCVKTEPSYPLVFRGNGNGAYWDWKIGEYFEVSGLGMDCTLIRTSILKDIPEPWFKTVRSDKYMDGVNDAEEWTEDLYFFNKLAEQGKWKVMCDASVICSHWDVYGNKSYGLPPDSLPMRQKVKLKDKTVLVIGEMIQMSDGDQFDITHFGDEDSDYRGHPSQLPFDADEFNWVILTNISHISDAVVIEALRVCKPGGKLTVHFTEFMDVARIQQHWARTDLHAVVVNDSVVELTKGA